MKKLVLFGLATLTATACGGGDAKSPGTLADLAPRVQKAFDEEATGDPVKATALWLAALESAAASPNNPGSPTVAMAALDALVHRDVSAFADETPSSALVDRIPPEALAKNGGALDARLAKIAKDAEGPFVAGLVARARLALAERRGDDRAAAQQRGLTGCVREATLLGPVSWLTVSGTKEPSILARAAALPAQVQGPGPFLPALRPQKVRAFGCHLPLYAQTSALGVREVAVDVTVPSDGTIGIALTSAAEALVHAGQTVVLERAHALGGGTVTRFARFDAGQGVLRLVVRAGMDSDYQSIDLSAWDANGKPLVVHAPDPGAQAGGAVRRATVMAPAEPRTDGEKLTVALGALAAKDHARAENLLEPISTRADLPPSLLLAYARALRSAPDLPNVKAQERARAAYDRVLEAAPGSWEATLEHAVLAGVRRGRAEANIATLEDLDALRTKSKAASPAILDAFEAQVAGREKLHDRARAAFERAKAPLAGTALLFATDRATFERTGKESVAFDCSDRAGDRSTLACHRSLVTAGERDAAERELERLRALGGTPQLYLSLSARSALEVGDLARASKILDAMNPGDRPINMVYATKGKAAVADLLRLAPVARDAPHALPSLLRDAGDDPIAPYEGIAERVVNDASMGAAAANAATAILAHQEHYDIDASGLVHFTMLDVRRVMGTTDVEANAEASAATIYGRDALRIIRRRIFKKDGRIVMPDRTPNAAQSHADLSQLEAGDAIEAIYEGWGLPSETGNVGIDTPDLMPERTAVRDAIIELRIPEGLKASLWSHNLLGKAEERSEVVNGQKKHVYAWHMKERPVRRLESGVPKMDRSVAVSFSTTTWSDVARGLRETLATLESPSPEVTHWAREATAGKTAPREIVDKIVAASGEAVKEANGMILADVDLGRAGSHGMTARSILVQHEGSRTWLVTHALRELGIATDIAVSENEPFSDSAGFPPRFGRFMHPLAIAHVPGPKGVEDVWIDADVQGPPLPAGRISPELRGRSALYPNGTIAALPAVGGEPLRDEIDIRLVVDEKGDAKGTITALLRGHSAQELADALVHLVGLERQRALRGIALGWVPFATVDKVELSSNEESWQVAMRAELVAPAYAQIEGTRPESRVWVLPGMDPVHYVFPRPFVTTLSSTYASQAARESALAINRATQYHVRRRVELPPGASIARLPGPFDGKGPLFGATRKIGVNGPTVEEDFTLDVTTGTVAQDRYEAFVAAARQTDDAFRASTRVKPPATAVVPGKPEKK